MISYNLLQYNQDEDHSHKLRVFEIEWFTNIGFISLIYYL